MRSPTGSRTPMTDAQAAYERWCRAMSLSSAPSPQHRGMDTIDHALVPWEKLPAWAHSIWASVAEGAVENHEANRPDRIPVLAMVDSPAMTVEELRVHLGSLSPSVAVQIAIGEYVSDLHRVYCAGTFAPGHPWHVLSDGTGRSR